MRLPDLKHWFGHGAAPRAAAHPARPASRIMPAGPLQDAVPDPDCVWPADRLSVVDALWGEGFQFPGGESEILRLVKPLGLSAATSLLLLGAGSGGPPCAIAGSLGVWVTGYETDPDLLAAATERSLRAGLARRAQVAPWDPHVPQFERGYFHHALALEPLREAKLEPALAALADALKPGGHLVLLETVADTPLDPADPLVAAWQRLDRHPLERLPSEVAVTRALARLGFDVRIVEDLSRAHIRQAVTGWREAVRMMEQAKPTHREAAMLVQEAELWLLRMRLFQNHTLRLLRWHAIGQF
jgi:SAM-dependent methyltransferase